MRKSPSVAGYTDVAIMAVSFSLILRDREGLLQVVFDPDRPEIFAEAERIRGEFVLAVKGQGSATA